MPRREADLGVYLPHLSPYLQFASRRGISPYLPISPHLSSLRAGEAAHAVLHQQKK